SSWARGRGGGRARGGPSPDGAGSRAGAARARTGRRRPALDLAWLSSHVLGSRESVGRIIARRLPLRLRRVAPGPSPHLAVDDRRGHDQEPLEEVLPVLVQAQEDGRV